MDEHDTYRAQDDPCVLAALDEVREWFAQWWAAWDWCCELGSPHALGGHEYRRLTAIARSERVPPTQTSMRLWIGRSECISPWLSVTEESLKRRVREAEAQTQKGDDHGGERD